MLRQTERRVALGAHRTACLTFGLLAVSALLGVALASAAPKTLPSNWMFRTDVQSRQEITDSVPGSNTIVDLVNIGSDVWAATGRGASRYSQSGREWVTYGVDDGLAANEVPALHVVPGSSKIWVATSHSDVVELQPVPYGDGLFFSPDDGITWMDRSPDVGQASGPFQICYDITSFRGRIVAACFAGGLVISDDDGLTWQNIYASAADRFDFENKLFQRFNNRFFSVAVDTTSPESLAVYAGSAAGINKFIYLDSSLKINGFAYRALAIDDSNIYAGTDIGLSQTDDRSATWQTTLLKHGIPTNLVGAVAAHGDTIWIGVDDVYGESGAGRAYSFDGGATWSTPAVQPEQTVGAGRRARSIVSAAGAWWVACENGGLICSEDDGATWFNVFADEFLAEDYRDNTPPKRNTNRVNTLQALTVDGTTTLWAGTDSGLVRYTVPDNALPVDATIELIDDESVLNLGQRILDLQLQESSDGLVLWSLNEAAAQNDIGTTGYAISLDSGSTWAVANAVLAAREVAFTGNFFWLLTDDGLFSGEYPNLDLDSLVQVAAVTALINDGRIAPPLHSLITEIDDSGDEPVLQSIWIGADSGLAFFPNSSNVWGVVLPNTDPLQPDTVVRTFYEGFNDTTQEFNTISGNFVTALERQETVGLDYIWVGTQTTGTGQSNGIARSSNGESNWTVPLTGHFVWNFAFDGNEVWVASSSGLLHSEDIGATWDTLSHFVDPQSGAFVDEETEIFAVEVVGDEIWLGTDNGFVVLDKNDPSIVRQVRRRFQPVTGTSVGGEGGAYASPVPFSANFHPNGVRFHFVPPVDGPVTLSIYDFANQLVKSFRLPGLDAGVQYDELIAWDGRNGKGDLVAIGTYFFVIEYSGGKTHWGKLAVIH